MMSTEAIFALIIGVLLIVILGGAIYGGVVLNDQRTTITQLQEDTNKSLILAYIYDWGYNINNPSQILFSFWLYNYGNVEGKDVNVICRLYDSNEDITIEGLYLAGNIASNSENYKEFSVPKTSIYSSDESYSASCFVKNCENCVNLYKNIPKLVEAYGR